MKRTLLGKIVKGLVLLSIIQTANAESLTHKSGGYYAAGNFVLNKQGANDSFENLSPDEFGYFFLNDLTDFNTMKTFSIKGREYHYYIPEKLNIHIKSKSRGIGMRLIPRKLMESMKRLRTH